MKTKQPSGPETGNISDPRITDMFAVKRMTNYAHTTSNGFAVVEMEAIPPNVNPFQYDAYHMGAHIDNGALTVMYADLGPEAKERYIILIDAATGQRLKVRLPPLGEAASTAPESTDTQLVPVPVPSEDHGAYRRLKEHFSGIELDDKWQIAVDRIVFFGLCDNDAEAINFLNTSNGELFAASALDFYLHMNHTFTAAAHRAANILANTYMPGSSMSQLAAMIAAANRKE